jgi:hypothetical protein
MSALDAARAVRHDLGKYVALEGRWLGDDASPEALRSALAVDLLRTRRGPEGDEDCVALWARLRPTVVELGVQDIDALVAELAAAMPRLHELDAAALRGVARSALALSEACRALTDRAGG